MIDKTVLLYGKVFRLSTKDLLKNFFRRVKKNFLGTYSQDVVNNLWKTFQYVAKKIFFSLF